MARKTRAAILPFPGDPFLLTYWLNLFDNVWSDEVDKLYIYFNSPIESEVVQYILSICTLRPKINIQYLDHMGDHGPSIDRCLDICTEELVMLIEDDGFIFKKGIVNSCFSQIESGQFDIVGGKRGSCAMEILLRAKEIWGLDYEGEGDHGPNFWPNFFFCSKELLLKTDRNFAAKAWYMGEEIPALIKDEEKYFAQNDVIYGDTFVNTSLQLRAIVPQNRILCLPQYHGSPDDLEHARDHKYLFDGQAPWTHVGSLSSGISGVLKDDSNRALARRQIDAPGGETQLNKEWCQTDTEKREWERRVQWWLTFYEFYKNSGDTTLRNFNTLYGIAIDRVIRQYKLNIDSIRQRQRVYQKLMII